MNFSPLCYPQDWPGPPSDRELSWERVPLVGKYVASYLKHRRMLAIHWEFEEQVSRRGPIPESIWGEDPRRLEAANIVIQQCVDAIGWEHPYFIPDDPFEIVIQLRTGDMCELDAILRIQRAFDVELSVNSDLGRRWYEESMTLGEMVDYLMEHSPSYAVSTSRKDL